MKRRTFLNRTAAISGLTILSPAIAFGSKANSAIRMGIIGCGPRGIKVITSMSQNTNINIIAMADLFEDKIQKSQKVLDGENIKKGFPGIQKSNIYVGSKAYLKLLQNGDVDAVLISSPSYTHPEFLKAAVSEGKHIYCEKPVSTDIDGCLRVERIGKLANGQLSIAFGFQIRYATPYIEMVKRIQQGDIGEILSAQLCFLSSKTPVGNIVGLPGDEARIRNQYNFLALSGGPLIDQSVHMIDVCNWVLQRHPIKAFGTGGIDKNQNYGDIWRHFQVVYDYTGINVVLQTTQYGPHFGDVCAKFIGTEGTAEAHYSGGVFISGPKQWDSGVIKCGSTTLTDVQRKAGMALSALHDADANKEIAFIKSIETKQYLNETVQGADSTLSAILGRQAAMTGKTVSWDRLNVSAERLDPKLNLSQFDS
jgi:myo-inositol 2-dehydrogenase / D-chiro-inositol 1-dehydrogenase